MSHFMKICAGTKFLDPLELVDDDFTGRMLMMALSSKYRGLLSANNGIECITKDLLRVHEVLDAI